MAKLLLTDLRGGEADEHPTTIADNQVAVAQDIDYWRNMLGGRRNGSTLLLSGLANEINSLLLYQPTLQDDGFLWTLNENREWHYYSPLYAETLVTPDPADVPDATVPAQGASLHGKMFVAAKTVLLPSGLNRLHVWDGTKLRRTGLAMPVGTMSASDQGSGGVSGIRYYRMRYITQSAAGIAIRRSEPSAVTTFTPSGSGLSVRVNKLAAINEGETHWEVEVSPDNAVFYRIATVLIGTSIYDDTIDLPQNIATTTGVVESAESGAYSLQGSYKWVIADRDRIIGFGNHTDSSKDANVEWSVVGSDPSGVGNDERVPTSTGNFVSLDGEESGPLTAGVAFDGRIFGFKLNRIYSLTQTGIRQSAYLPQIVSNTFGALENSVREGTDADGRAALYFVDPEVGPMALFPGVGFKVLAPHLRDKFQSEVNFGAAYKLVNAVFHRGKGQMWWNFTGVREFARGCCPPATILPDWPSFRWVYDVKTGGTTFQSFPRLARDTIFWQGKPLQTAEGGALVLCDDDGTPDDYGYAFRAYVQTRAYELGDLIDRFVVRSGMFEGRSIGLSPGRRLACPTPSGVNLVLTLIRDYELERKSVTFSLDQVGGPSDGTPYYTIARIDNARMNEATALQFEYGDAEAVSVSPWVLHKAAFVVDIQGHNVS